MMNTYQYIDLIEKKISPDAPFQSLQTDI